MNLDTHIDFPTSRREQVARIIREAILSGRLKPGERIKEKDIAEKLEVSRGPIREAMRQLEEEGLLISYPYKETVVAQFSEDEIVDVFIPIRIILESYSVQKACAHLDEKDANQLQAYVDNMLKAGEENNLSMLVENNLLFHKYLISITGSKSLEQIWNSIMNRIRIHFYHLGKTLDLDLSQHALEHQEILNAIKAKDTEKCLSLLKKHIK